MKKKMQFALGAFFALSSTLVSAQKDERFMDTITISPAKDFVVMLVGHNINEIKEKNRFDSLKTLFIADWEQAIASNAYPANAKQTFYFVASNGKRRLKTESEEYQAAIDVDKEKQSLEAGLPAYHYTIYDLARGYQYHIYTNDPQKIPLLKDMNCNEIMAKTLTDKKANTKRAKVDIINNNNEWKAEYFVPQTRDFLVLSPTIGANLTGNSWSPSIGASMYVQFGNKYGTPKLKLGVTASSYMLSDYGGFQFKNVYAVGDFEGRLLWNTTHLTQPKKPIWLGVGAGRINGYGKGDLDKSFKAGVIMQYKDLEYSFNFIKSKNTDKNLIYGLSVKFLF
jgi:hypothetical protein